MSTLEYGQDDLSSVDYESLIGAITQALSNCKIPTLDERSISFDLDTIANDVAFQFARSNKYPFENKDGTTYASIHFPTIDKKDAFSAQIRQLVAVLRRCIEQALQAKLGYGSIERYIKSLLSPLGTFSDRQIAGLKYPLTNPISLQKQRLHLKPPQKPSDPWLKGHKLTIQVKDIKTFDRQLIQGIITFIEQQGGEEKDIEEVREILETMTKKPDSSLSQLRDIVTKQSLARIQREAKVNYLLYLYNGIKEWKSTKKEPGMALLNTLIQRLKMLDAYIRQEIDDAHFQVTYQGETFNYRDLLSRADAFDTLPIITEIEGSLGESTNKEHGAKKFVSGVKLKLNGKVQVYGGAGKPVYDYNVALLDPESEAYRKRQVEAKSQSRFQEKVLKVALLYYFVFVQMDNTAFQPAEKFEAEILNAFRANDEAAKVSALRNLQQQINTAAVKENINAMRKLLVEFLDEPHISLPRWEYPLVLSLQKSILMQDIDSMITHNIFFREGFEKNGGLDSLKYIAVEDAVAGKEAICKLPITMTFETMYYYPAEDQPEKFTMIYDTAGVQMLPVFLAPVEQQNVNKYKEVYRSNRRIVFYYRHRPEVVYDSERAFVYRFTYTLLTYVTLKLLADSLTGIDRRKLFFPLICLHALEKSAEEQNRKFDDEEFMHALSKVLAHMLAEDYTASSQGFHLSTVQGKGNDSYKLQNALYSLYSALPRQFRLTSNSTVSAPAQPQLEKLAIVVVSSRRCDVNKKAPEYYQATVFGEIVGIERLPNGSARVGTLSTFSANQPSDQLYKRPEAIVEQIKACYAKGYRRFLYVARAPYSSTLHISDSGSDEELFFMNRDIIQAIREVSSEIKVYPVFCDKYYVVNQKRNFRRVSQVDSLYVDDIGELSNLVADPSKQSLVFLNLFSGASITRQVYNGVMSYAALINVYENDPTYDQYIWADLLNERTALSIKGDLLDYITLLHFSRYEKPSNPGFKLDPYRRTIGDTSVGKVAIFPHMKGTAHFNALAFVTLVRAVLHAKGNN